MRNWVTIVSTTAIGFALIQLSACIPGLNDEELCTNTCQYANDGVCDDGGPNSVYNLCDCGTDCSDCNERAEADCDNSSSSSSSSGSSSSGSSSSGGSSSSSSGSSSSGSSSSSSGGNGIYNVVFVMTPGQGSDCGALFACTGNMTFEVRRVSDNSLVMSNGVLDVCGPTYDGVNGPNPPYCNSPNTVFLPNLQEGVTYRWNSTCSTQNGDNDDTGTFTEGTGSSFTSDGCRRIAIY